MRRVRQGLLLAGLVLALAIFAMPSWAQSSPSSAPIAFSALVENARGGQIDWGKEMMYASGEGAMPSASEEPNRARAKLKAKEYAKMAAIANLFQLIEGTSISYNAVGKNFMAEDITLKQTIEGYVRNVSIVRMITRKEEGDTIVKVTVGTPMYGKGTPGTALLQKLSENELTEPDETPIKIEEKGEAPKVVQPKPAVVTNEEEKPELPKIKIPEPVITEEPKPVAPRVEESKPEEDKPVTPPAPDGPVIEKVVDVTPAVVPGGKPNTSVIIDTLGLNVMRAMSPKLRTSNGDEVWGTLSINADDVQSQGPVAYTRSMADAMKSSRAGSNPLVVKAIGRAGGTRMCDVVLSDEDVAKLKAADGAAQPPFLSAMKVILVVDPAKAFRL